MPASKVMLEKDIEKKVCDYAREHGFLVYKFTSPSQRSVPDRMLISDEGEVFFIEFKRPGGRATDGQLRELYRLNSQGVAALIVDDVDTGKHIIDMVYLGIDPRVFAC